MPYITERVAPPPMRASIGVADTSQVYVECGPVVGHPSKRTDHGAPPPLAVRLHRCYQIASAGRFIKSVSYLTDAELSPR